MSQNVKALFITGKETMNEYVEVVEGAHEEHKKKTTGEKTTDRIQVNT